MSSIDDVSKKPAMASESSNPEPVFSTKTPDRKAILTTRSRDCEIAISFPEVKPYGSRDRNVQIKPVKRQILTSPRKPETILKLPERFEILDEIFNGLDTAFRLLKLKGSSTSFANLCPKIEYLTNRIFTYDHLAQMKHIYPEAIQVKRVLSCDVRTSCMKPSLHINLNTDAIVLEDTSCGTKYMQLRKVFHSKLVDFYKAHPKDEIPKELLPEPFNSAKRGSYSETKSVVDMGASKLENDKFDAQMEEMEQEDEKVNKVIPDSTLSDGTEQCLSSHTESRIVGTPAKVVSTPSKDLSTPIRFMSATPTLQPSRRCITMTPDDDNGSVRSTSVLERRPSRTRCLNFDTLEEDGTGENDVTNKSDGESVDEGINCEADDASSDEDSLLHSMIEKPDVTNKSDGESVDEGINCEADDASSDEDSLLHSMIEKPKADPEKKNLPKLVSLVHKLFHSTKRSIITKEELLHKMIACQVNITDRKEVEEQLRLMLRLVPDWISETKASSGDFLVRIDKMSTAETVRERLEEATSQGISTIY